MRTSIQPGNKVGGPLAVIVLAVALPSTGAQETAAAQPKKVIYETDMCLDVDDVGGLALLHALADQGEVDILAVTFNEVHPSGAAAIDAINTWYGRGGIAVGIYNGTLAAPDTSKYLGPVAAFPHDLARETASTALEVYRKVLAEQPDKSVTIISVGFLNNLHDLLKADPDLVAKKVKELVVMASRNNDGFNLSRHDLVAQSEYVVRHWPTPLVISSHGGGTKTGGRLSGTAAGNPVREAYYQWFDQSYQGRSSWDQIAILYGVRGLGTCFREITTGKGTLRNGFEWQMQPGHRSYLQAKLSDQEFVDIIEPLMIQPPRKQLAGGMDTHQPVQAQGPKEEPPAGAPYSPHPEKVVVTRVKHFDNLCWKIATAGGTWYFENGETEGKSGFSSAFDQVGNDWIGNDADKGYNKSPSKGGRREYRGWPNFGEGNFDHPQRKSGTSTRWVDAGGKEIPFVNRLEGDHLIMRSANANYELEYHFFPTHAAIKVLKANGKYAFLFEGPIGGEQEASVEKDYYVLKDGKPRECKAGGLGYLEPEFGNKFPSPFFYLVDSDPKDTQVLYIGVKDAGPETAGDEGWRQGDNMVIFSYGRDQDKRAYTGTNAVCVFGFHPKASGHGAISSFIEARLANPFNAPKTVR